MGVTNADNSRFCHIHGVIAVVWHVQIPEQKPAIAVRIRAHATLAFGRKRREFGHEFAFLVKEFFGAITLHPFFE